MYNITATAVARLEGSPSERILEWGCPVPFFGAITRARIATVGINPSNREFVDSLGIELAGRDRRLPTMTSLGLSTWGDATPGHLRTMVEECGEYFERNPYDRWFKVLDVVLSGTGSSFYDRDDPACHVDLVPYTTRVKWNDLEQEDRLHLLDLGSDILGRYLRESRIRLLVLNGQSVVRQFEALSDCRLERSTMIDWTLARAGSAGIPGIAYSGSLSTFGGVDLGRRVAVLGYNHNLQSSYGVKASVIDSIKNWLSASWQALDR